MHRCSITSDDFSQRCQLCLFLRKFALLENTIVVLDQWERKVRHFMCYLKVECKMRATSYPPPPPKPLLFLLSFCTFSNHLDIFERDPKRFIFKVFLQNIWIVRYRCRQMYRDTLCYIVFKETVAYYRVILN